MWSFSHSLSISPNYLSITCINICSHLENNLFYRGIQTYLQYISSPLEFATQYVLAVSELVVYFLVYFFCKLISKYDCVRSTSSCFLKLLMQISNAVCTPSFPLFFYFLFLTSCLELGVAHFIGESDMNIESCLMNLKSTTLFFWGKGQVKDNCKYTLDTTFPILH